MKCVTCTIQKGGTGKTSSVLALAQAAVSAGQRVLITDCDMQGNATALAGADKWSTAGTYSIIAGVLRAGDVIQHTEQGIDVIAGTSDLMAVQTKPGSVGRLYQALQSIADDYDLCLLDTGPAISEVTFEAIHAADLVLICSAADAGSLEGLYTYAGIAPKLRKPGAALTRTVICNYDGRSNLRKFWRSTLETKAAEEGAAVIGVIRSGVAVGESQTMHTSIYTQAPRSRPAQDYKELYSKMMDLLEKEA